MAGSENQKLKLLFLYQILLEETDEEALLKAMLAEYDVGEETARSGIAKFLGKLSSEGLLE